MNKSARLPETLVGWMESLADRTRLRLMHVLERHELGVVELCEILQLPQSTVSRHLKLLSDQNWVRSRRDGTTRMYRTILEELDPAARKLWLLAREQTNDWTTIQQDEMRLVRRLRHREADSQAFFAGAASEWDKLRRELYGESFTTAAMLALLPADSVIADLGCGTGQVASLLAGYARRVIGIDNSSAMLKAARKRVSDRSNVDLFRADLSAVPLDAGTCDAALLLLVLTYAPDVSAVLREVHRILKPGGKLVIIDLLPHDRDDFRRKMEQQHMGFDPEQLKQLLLDAGFASVSWRPLLPEPQAKGPALMLMNASTPAANRPA